MEMCFIEDGGVIAVRTSTGRDMTGGLLSCREFSLKSKFVLLLLLSVASPLSCCCACNRVRSML